jgi:pimeloyl-ACP methyl ester carboxylesterase
VNRSVARLLLGAVIFACGLSAQAQNLGRANIHYLTVDRGLRLEVLEYKATRKASLAGDILYLPGYDDSFQKHYDLFERFVKSGFRVLSFNYPCHGGTAGKCNNLNSYNFKQLGGLASAVEQAFPAASPVPLYVTGYDLGGLLAIRMLQSDRVGRFQRPIEGVAVHSPPLPPRWILEPGMDRTLVNFDIEDEGLIARAVIKAGTYLPEFVLRQFPVPDTYRMIYSFFHLRFWLNVYYARKTPLPQEIPLLVVTGGEEDVVVVDQALRRWADAQVEQCGVRISYETVPQSGNLDSGEMGPRVRQRTAAFFEMINDQRAKDALKAPTNRHQRRARDAEVRRAARDGVENRGGATGLFPTN